MMERKNYLVTGVSRGLGIEIAGALLRDENTAVYGLSRSKTAELEMLLARYPERMSWMSFDLADSTDLTQLQHVE